ncbi:MAG TPA: hypothetical protein DEA45_01380 [Acholeplasmataceae bacterium]|nr:hypothetical protein [Acholeplasmataceae bacterium]
MESRKKMSKTGELLKQLRQEKGLTLQEVANQIDCSPSFLHRLENNTRQNPSIHTASKLAAFYEIDVTLLAGTDQAQIAPHSLDFAMKKEIAEELAAAIEKMKEGFSLFDTETEENKQAFIEVQKSLLYVQSLI